jgi:hypothetical protein
LTNREEVQFSGYSLGADLWIAPETMASSWSQNLDWYLNFQIAKSNYHHAATLAEPLKEILTECEIPYLEDTFSEDALMISASHLLPTKWVLIIKNGTEIKDWAERAAQKCQALKPNQTRIFLPKGITEKQFLDLWKNAGGPAAVEVIIEPVELSHG